MTRPPARYAPNPDGDNLTGEMLTAPALVRLFGRPFEGLQLGTLGIMPARRTEGEPMLARIYGFSWQGSYTPLTVPSVFVVYGDGFEIARDAAGAALGLSGVAETQEVFAPEMRMWLAHEQEVNVRIDISVGFTCDILLRPELMGSGDAADTLPTSRSIMASAGKMVSPSRGGLGS